MRNIIIILVSLFIVSCTSPTEKDLLADQMEESLFTYIVDTWYPLCIDSTYGGYIPDFEYDWTLSEGKQIKALVQQARHLWTLSYLYEKYPEHSEYLQWAKTGFNFIQTHFWDHEYGGFFYETCRDGSRATDASELKKIYGQAFAVNGLAQYFRVTGDSAALDLAMKAFAWMNDRPYDKEHGGYFECINRDGSPQEIGDGSDSYSAMTGLKEFNSTIHILEAFTELYKANPTPLVQEKLEEIFYIVRDTFVKPDGYLQLYFYPDWTPVPDATMKNLSGGNFWYTQHITYGHDVETAFLLLETEEVLGHAHDTKTNKLAKKMVDHALNHGWDTDAGGFYYVGYEHDGQYIIHIDEKAWWVEAEGLNALIMMHTLHPEDSMDYYAYFKTLWNYTDTYLIDKEHGAWYNYGLDISPENKLQKKSHNWKATYHNVRGMVRSIELLRE